jgi:hypothetical protein
LGSPQGWQLIQKSQPSRGEGSVVIRQLQLLSIVVCVRC